MVHLRIQYIVDNSEKDYMQIKSHMKLFKFTYNCNDVIYKMCSNRAEQIIPGPSCSLRHKFVKQISAKVTNTLLFFVEKM